jgi:hypothetical protein
MLLRMTLLNLIELLGTKCLYYITWNYMKKDFCRKNRPGQIATDE